jgi:hypothetical protein
MAPQLHSNSALILALMAASVAAAAALTSQALPHLPSLHHA